MMFSLFSVLIAIALVDFVHCIVVSKEIFNVLFVVVDFVPNSGEWKSSVAPECLECSGTDMQQLHYVLTVQQVVYKVLGWQTGVHCAPPFFLF